MSIFKIISRHRARLGRNVLIEFSLLMFSVILVTSATLGYVLTGFVRGHVIRMHGSFYAQGLTTVFPQFLESENEEQFKAIVARFELSGSLPHVEELAIWDSTGTQVFGDLGENKTKELDLMVRGALNGLIQYSYQRGNFLNSGVGNHKELFLYLPITDAFFKVIGIVGLRESDDALIDDLSAASAKIVLYVVLAGFLIYVSLFISFYHAYNRQLLISERLQKSQDSIIFAMSSLSSLRDQETGGHLERCRAYVGLLASKLIGEPKYKEYVDDQYIRDLASIAPLHDIGKVGIEDSILRKPGKLTDCEFDVMKTHSALGSEILQKAREQLPFNSQLELAVDLTRHHHERWDGKGYPSGLAGASIPLSARIMALADVYDALRSERYYKKGMSHIDAVKIIESGSGSQFDPLLVSVFLKNHVEFESIFMGLAI